MRGLLLVPVLVLGGAIHKEWSEKHGVGMSLPNTWRVVERDRGDLVFDIVGPKLGPSNPRARLLRAGGAAGAPLQEIVKRARHDVEGRDGWLITSQARRSVGAFPCVRMGVRFPGGRGRVTVALLGDAYYVLELSSAASHFPAATFDGMESSLGVAWREDKHPDGLVFKLPPGWSAQPHEEGGLRIEGPRREAGATFLLLQRDDAGREGDGAQVAFLGEKRKSHVEEREVDGVATRRLQVSGGGWTGQVLMPVEAWDDFYPVAEAILGTARAAG
ncbi:MAG: hypothetical protein ACREID_08460 [Planctomycetota bacterium]